MIDTTNFVKSLNQKPVAVYGLGLSGLSVAKSLINHGAKVYAWDEGEEKRRAAEKIGIKITNFENDDFKIYGALVLSPGIPLNFPSPHPVVEMARASGVEIIGDIEIFSRCGLGLKTLGITGTNGKSTTTALIHHILNEAKIKNVMGGNIGMPILDMNIPSKNSVVVLELSSYQLDLCPSFKPDISILLNITPDHLDRHGNMEGYISSKEKIFDGDGIAICNIDDDICLNIFERTKKAGFRNSFAISIKKEIDKGIYIKDGILFDCLHGNQKEMGSVLDLSTLPGVHNQQNICAAYAACRLLGVDSHVIFAALKTYKGLAHRQFLTTVINGVVYINDSKATNFDAASKAIACYKNIYLIAGGRAKEGGLSGLEYFQDNIRHVFLIGEAADDFAMWLDKRGIPNSKSYSLDVAVLEAHKMAQSNRGEPGPAGTVLLSPACASWDQFRNFEHRGDVFMDLVKTLSDEVSL